MEYPVFKGLQKPLEFLRIRGRFLYFAAATAGGSFLVYLIAGIIFGQLIGLAALAASLIIGLAAIYIKQHSGLHSKKRYRGVLIFHKLFIG